MKTAYIVIACIILQSSVFNFHYSVNYLLYEVSVMRNCDNSALVLIYCLLKEQLWIIIQVSDTDVLQ